MHGVWLNGTVGSAQITDLMEQIFTSLYPLCLTSLYFLCYSNQILVYTLLHYESDVRENATNWTFWEKFESVSLKHRLPKMYVA